MDAWTHLKSLQLYGATVTDETLAVIRNFRELDSLMLYQTAISDAALRHLRYLDALTWLDIGDHMPNHDRPYGTLTPNCVHHIVQLPALRRLDIQRVKLSDDSLRLIASNLPSLQHLWLQKCNISDSGLKYLQALSNLTSLCLRDNSNVTEAGLQHLNSLKSLETLDLTGTSVSRDVIQRLRAKKPTVNIIFYYPRRADRNNL
jgi:Leucine-rich repeat (LRR) protein